MAGAYGSMNSGWSSLSGDCSQKTRKSFMYLSCIPQEVLAMLPTNIEKIAKDEHQLLLDTLENMEKSEQEFFSLDTIFHCVLAYISADLVLNPVRGQTPKTKKEVSELLDKILEKEPENLLALCVKQKLNKVQYKKANNREEIKRLESCEKSKSNAFAIVAFYLYKLRIIEASVELFERAIKTWSEEGEGSSIKVVTWKYYLAAAYSQSMHKDIFTKHADFNPEAIMSRITELLQDGIDVGGAQGKPFLEARCYIDLAGTFRKYQLIGIPKERRLKMPITADEECYERAWTKCGGQDPHVMEKYGQYLRKTACSEESLKCATKVFKDLLKKCPHRHVAAHQLALTYKALWFIEDDLEHRFLYLNSVRTGKVESASQGSKNTRKKQRKAQKTKMNQETLLAAMDADIAKKEDVVEHEKVEGAVGGSSKYDMDDLVDAPGTMDVMKQAVEEHETTPEASDGRSEPMNLAEGEGGSTERIMRKSDKTDMCVDSVTDSLDRTLQTSVVPIQLPTKVKTIRKKEGRKDSRRKTSKCTKPILPCSPTDYKEVPQHKSRKPGYYHNLQADNPKPKSANSQYLACARKYFEQANDITQNSRVLYLVDLARIHISLGENDEAMHRFHQAKRVISAATVPNDQDKAYLYEQWALMLFHDLKHQEEQNFETDTETSEMSDAEDKIRAGILNKMEDYFFKSIRSATKIKSKSRVAFYKLAEILEGREEKWKSLYEIYKFVGRKQEAQAILAKQKETCTGEQVRKLYKNECMELGEEDKFLNLYYTVGSEMPADRESLIQDIAEVTLHQAIGGVREDEDENEEEEEETPLKTYAAYGGAMKLGLQQSVKRRVSPQSSEDERAPKKHEPQRLDSYPVKKSESEDVKIVFMARNEYTDSGVFHFIYDRLVKFEGIEVKIYYPDAAGDLIFGRSVDDQIEEFVKKAGLVLVSDFESENGERYFLDIVRMARHFKQETLILRETDKRLPKAWEILPTEDIRKVDSEAHFHNFMTVIFTILFGKDFSHCKRKDVM